MTLKLDPKGYFLIRINLEKNDIEIGFCTYKDKKVIKQWSGNNGDELLKQIISDGDYISLDSHKKYLLTEFEKALECIKTGKEYIQD